VTTANLLPLHAPFDGIVIHCDMVEGEVVSSSQPQFAVADVRRLWVTLNVRQEDISRVRKGQRLRFRSDGMTGVEATGTVSWISTEVDDKTRTARVRADVENSNGQLRAHSFGSGTIFLTEKPNALTVPSESLQWDGSYHLVFVRQSDGLAFERRLGRIGLRNQEYTEILDGIQPGDVVATLGSHVLRSELVKGEEGGAD